MTINIINLKNMIENFKYNFLHLPKRYLSQYLIFFHLQKLKKHFIFRKKILIHIFNSIIY